MNDTILNSAKQRGIPLHIDQFDKKCLIASIYLDASRKQEVVLLVLCSRTKLFSMKYSMKCFLYIFFGGGGVRMEDCLSQDPK